MSQDSAVNIVLPVEQVKVKKPRAPSLQAKDAKIIQAIFWYLKSQKSEPDEGLSDDEFTSIQLFASVQQQKAFTDTFFQASKDIAKEIRVLQNDKKKTDAKAAKYALKAANATTTLVKQKRVRKSKATSHTDTDSLTHALTASSDTPADSKKKKHSKVVQNTQDSLINELVTLARNSSASEPPFPVNLLNDPMDKVATEPMEKVAKEPMEKVAKEPKEKVAKEPKEKVAKEPKEKVAKEPKDKVAKEPKEKVAKEPKDKVTKEPKEKVAKEPKEKVAKEPKEKVANSLVQETTSLDHNLDDHNLADHNLADHNLTDHDDHDDDDELDVSPFSFNGVDYLISDDFSLFHPTSQLCIGTFDSSSNSILFI